MTNETQTEGRTTRNLLVVEDNPNHLEDLKSLLARRTGSRLELRVDYATTLEEATQLLEGRKYDGVMSDLFFPTKIGGLEEELNGTKMAQQAFDKGIPVVMVTSVFHHDKKIEPAHYWALNHKFYLIDTVYRYHEYYSGDKTCISSSDEREKQGKNFLGGLLALGYIIEAQRNGSVSVSPDGYTKDRAASDITLFANRMYSYLKGDLEELFGYTISPKDQLLRQVIDEYCSGIMPEEIQGKITK